MKKQLNLNVISRKSIDLRQYSSPKATYKLLNKNLNFVPRQKKCNGNHLNQVIENLSGKKKLSAHFRPNEANKEQLEEAIFKLSSNKT